MGLLNCGMTANTIPLQTSPLKGEVSKSVAPVGAAEAAMLFARPLQNHRGFRRSYKWRFRGASASVLGAGTRRACHNSALQQRTDTATQ